MQAVTALQPGRYYHIYNRGNNREDLFLGEHDYRRFFELYAHHMSPVANTYAYCLMRNHFHLLLRIKSEQEWRATLAPEYQTSDLAFKPSQRFSNLFNAYTKWFNAAHRRTGSLFEERFAPTKLQRQDVLNWFDGSEKLEQFHRGVADERAIAALIEGDFV